MKLQYKIQSFQTDAAQAVVDVFRGQQNVDTWQYVIDSGKAAEGTIDYNEVLMGTRNADLTLDDDTLLANINAIQRKYDIAPSQDLQRGDDELRLTIEMETGTGKTYTYIKTMFELNKHYGWTKFIIVVPSIAIREGVLKSFDSMREHFVQEYGQVIDHFVYNSDHLNRIDTFAQNSGISAMIINYQAFAASGAEARKIYKRLDSFRSRKPIEVIAAMHPIMIIDEPQSVLGADKKNVTRKMLAEFCPAFSLLYSATHRKDDIRNQIFRLDAVDAYQRHLVKKICVKGVEVKGDNATSGFVYVNDVRPEKSGGPVASITFDKKTATGLRQTTQKLVDGDDLYELSDGLEEYRNGFIIDRIDARDNSVKFHNGLTLYAGEASGNLNEDIKRRIQIRETITSHLERENQLFKRGIKVLSLFFIDEVKKYRDYDCEDQKGIYAQMFEKEYNDAVSDYISRIDFEEDKPFHEYLRSFTADQVHNGYFSQDKKGNMIDSTTKRGSESSDDQSAYDLIMKNKERLLSLDEPTRFIFSHSALKEGWDNPNVFQICTLKDPEATADVTRKRQEVGRGLRLCVNQQGVRQDERELGAKGVFDVNILTVIASESYDSFARDLQKGIAAAVSNRPVKVDDTLFAKMVYTDANGNKQTVTTDEAKKIYKQLYKLDYIDDDDKLTDKYFKDKKEDTLDLPKVNDIPQEAIARQLEKVFNPDTIKVENAKRTRDAVFKQDRFQKAEFQQLWKKINHQTYYSVDFNTPDLIKDSITYIDDKLQVSHLKVTVKSGAMNSLDSKQSLEEGTAMKADSAKTTSMKDEQLVDNQRYDLIGRLVDATQLTRRTIIAILQGIKPSTFLQYKINPEEFIIKVGNLINEKKAIAVIEKITYHTTDKVYESDIFTQSTIRGVLGKNAIESDKSLYDLVVVDSEGIEKDFANELEIQEDVAVYTKLPGGFKINTPVGNYNPDWAVVFREGTVKHIYFIAETKGSNKESDLREVEKSKIKCAARHFAAISSSNVKYDVVKDYETMLNIVRGE